MKSFFSVWRIYTYFLDLSFKKSTFITRGKLRKMELEEVLKVQIKKEQLMEKVYVS